MKDYKIIQQIQSPACIIPWVRYQVLICCFLCFNSFVIAQNNPPVFTSSPEAVVANSEAYQYIIKASDPDGGYVTVNAPILPSWLNFTSRLVSSYAGSGLEGYLDGEAQNAKFSEPTGIAVDSKGNIYIAELNNHLIRKIDTTGIVSTYAGTGDPGFVNGPADEAQFNNPNGIAIDKLGNLYITEQSNHTIRKIDTGGNVTTFAGTGSAGYYDTLGVYAQFSSPRGIAADTAGNLYVADYYNHVIRKVTPGGKVSTFAGSGLVGELNGTASVASFNYPADVAVDAEGNVYVCDSDNHIIRKINKQQVVSTMAGSGVGGNADGPGETAEFWYPVGVTADCYGNLYVSDRLNESIRKIGPGGYTTTIAGKMSPGYKEGTGEEAKFNGVAHLVADSVCNIYLAESTNNKIRKIENYLMLKGDPLKNAGEHLVRLTATDSQGEISIQEFTLKVNDVIPPNAICLSDTILYLNENGYVTLDANSVNNGSSDENGIASLEIDINTFTTDYTDMPLTVTLTVSDNSSNISTCTTKVLVFEPAPDSAPVFISTPLTTVTDTQYYEYQITNYDINGDLTGVSASILPGWLSLSDKFPVTTYSGADLAGNKNGDVSEALFNAPNGMVADSSGNIYIADVYNHCIRKINKEGEVSLVAGSGTKGFADGDKATACFDTPIDVTIDKWGNLYVADYYNHAIRKILPGGTVQTLAGTGNAGYYNGPGNLARFNYPIGVAADSAGNIFVADFINHRIRKIDPEGNTTTFAGSGKNGFTNGPVEDARFFYPSDVEFGPDGNLLVCDNGNNSIRKILLGTIVTTIAGTGNSGFSDGGPESTTFDSPAKITADSLGNIFVADYNNFSIREITGDGFTTTIAGNGTQGIIDSTGINAGFSNAFGVVMGSKGILYVSDSHRIRAIETLPLVEGSAKGQAGTHQVKLEASDKKGNSSCQEFEIVVSEKVAPIALCHDTVVYINANGSARVSANDIDNGSYDSSGIQSLKIDKDLFTCEDLISVQEVELTATDIYSNVASCTAFVTVADIIKPQFAHVNDIYLEVDLYTEKTTVDYPEITASDNCSVSYELIQGLGQTGEFPIGINKETWRAVDGSGNSKELTFNIEVAPDNIPVFDPIQDISVKEDTPSVQITLKNILWGEGFTVKSIKAGVLGKENSSLVSGIKVNYETGNTTGVVQFNIYPNAFGEESFSVTITDNEGRFSLKEFNLEVVAVNDPPYRVNSVEDVQMYSSHQEEIEINPSYLFSDPDDTILNIDVLLAGDKSLPSWLAYQGDYLTATPAQTDTGCINIVIIASDPGGLTATDTFRLCVSDSLTGSNQNFLPETGLILYPNPADTEFTIEIKSHLINKFSMQLINNAGQVLFEKECYGNKTIVDCPALEPAVYFLKINAGKKQFTRKLVIK